MDVFIFGAFLALNLIVGFTTGREIKTIKDYALGGKNFSTLTLTATIIATWFGGGSLYYTLANTYSQGLYFALALLGTPFGLLFSGQVLAGRMGKFLESVSVAEAMGDIYGQKIRTISAISGIAGQIGYIAMQFQVIARILALFWGGENESLTILAAAIVILYSSMGGVRAVTFTDVVQFFTFGTFIPLLALIIWSGFQNPEKVSVMLVSNPNFHLSKVVGWNARFANTIALTLFYTLGGITPPLFQRISMARNAKQAQKAFTYAAIISLFIFSCIAWVGVLLLVDNPNLDPGKLVNYLIETYTYPGFKGMMAAGILALAMSTADSYINSCAVLFTNDLAAPLRLRRDHLTLYARLSSLGVGVLALLLSLYKSDLLSLLLLSGSFYLPIVGTPLLLAILGFRSTPRVVLISMAAGFGSVILWRIFFLDTGIDSVMPATFASLVTMLSTHYLLGEPGGWQKLEPDSPLGRERAARQEAWEARKEAIRHFRIYPYLQESLPQEEGLYSLFGFYTIAATYMGFYTMGQPDIQPYRALYEGIYPAVLLLTTLFITYPVWPSWLRSQRWMTFFWPLAVGYILFFVGTLLLLISHFHPMQLLVLLINFFIAALLLPWSLAAALALGGSSLAIGFFQYYTGEVLLWGMLGALQLNMLHGLLLLTILLMALLQGKQAYSQLGRKNQALLRLDQDHQADLLQSALENRKVLRALQGTGVDHLLTIIKDLQGIALKGQAMDQLHAIETKLIPIAFQLQGLDTRAQDYLRLKIEKLALPSWCGEIKKAVRERGVTAVLHCRQHTKYQELNGDGERLTSLLVSSIVALNTAVETEKREERPTILLRIEDTQLSYPLPDVAEGYIKYIPAVRIVITAADDLPLLKASYSPNLAGPNYIAPNTTDDLPRLANSRIVKSHYGYVEVADRTLVYVVPVDVQEVRPQDMDKDYMEVGADPKRADDKFVNQEKGVDAQAQEKAFLADVAKRSKADLGTVKMALELIKWYHGPKERHSGEPFYLHPLTVAHIVLDYNAEQATIIGALLHDTVEDTPMLLQHIEGLFGKETAEVVDLVTHLQSIPGSIYKVKLSSVENLQMLERAGEKIGLYVKLADRMHNMRTILGHKNIAKRKLIAEETLQFFVPLAKRLGLTEAAQELEKRCLEVMETQA